MSWKGKTKRVVAILESGGVLKTVDKQSFTCFNPIGQDLKVKIEDVMPLFDAHLLRTISYGIVGWLWVLAPSIHAPTSSVEGLDRILSRIDLHLARALAEPSTSETGSGNDYSTQSGGSLLDGPGEAREIPSE